MRHNAFWTLLVLLSGLLLSAGCSTVKEVPAVGDEGFKPSDMPADSIISRIPDYQDQLQSVEGKGKAIVSEPGNSDRVTLYFKGNRSKSLITIKNSIGIEGGQILSDGDSLLIYNKVDKYARKISVTQPGIDNINNLATVNLVAMLTLPVPLKQVRRILENEDTYLLHLPSGARVYVNKENMRIRQVTRPAGVGAPYAQINYDGYSAIGGLQLPRRITIFSADRSAKVDLLVQSLEVNPDLDPLTIDLPDDIKIYHR